MAWNPYFRYLALGGALILSTGLFPPAHAQDPDDLQRGVARISVMNGDVSVRRGDSGEWVAGVINAPLMSEDSIATGPDSRAEVQFDAANILRIGGNAEVRLTQLEANRFQMQVARGTVTYRVLQPTSAYVEVDTPSISVRPSNQGAYRIYVNDAGESRLIVRAGEVEVYSPRGSQSVSAGQMMMARGSATDPEFQMVAAPALDEWDQWCDSRDQVFLNSTSSQYVGQGIYGAEDLDNYGNWVDVAPYGRVWRPTVGEDWAPYSLGRWSWLDWYGWTWMSSDPWGWAPYHYGRWFHESRWGWCWYPGAFGYRHYWSPALVGFFGFGRGGGFGFGFGNVGWVPLAPYETLHPWWGRGYYGRGFGRSFNVTNVNIRNIYRNAGARNGISGISTENFRNGRFGRGGISHFSGEQVRGAGMIRGQMPFAPNNDHLRFSNRNVASVPRTSTNTRFFTHQQPRAVERIPFSQQRAGGAGLTRGAAGRSGIGAQAQGGADFNRGGLNRGGALSTRGSDPAPAARQGNLRSAQGDPGGQSSGGRGWRRFGEPSARSPQSNLAPRSESGGGRAAAPGSNRALDSSRPSGGAGWQRFGAPGSGRQQSSAAPRSSAPQYGSPGNGAMRSGRPEYGSPGYGTPRNAPSYGSPRGNGSYGAPRSFGGGGNSAPRSAPSAPRYSAPRNYGGGGGAYTAPRSAPSAPRYSAPRNYGGGGGYTAPRSAPRSAPSAPRYSAPRNYGGGGAYTAPRSAPSAPRYSAPRNYGGGGGYTAPRSAPSAPRYSAPRSSGGGGFSAPRSSGGGGGGGSRSAPRSSGGGSHGGGGGRRR